jgi:hypothetical protein
MRKDFEKAARDAVDKYYEYQNGRHTKHERQYRLYNVYKVTTSSAKNGKGYTIDATITLDSDYLEGLYYSNSTKHDGSQPWKQGGDVEAEYVFENFIKGAHPWTNGWPLNGEKDLEYKLIRKRPSPGGMLDKYLKNYELHDRFDEILYDLLRLY